MSSATWPTRLKSSIKSPFLSYIIYQSSKNSDKNKIKDHKINKHNFNDFNNDILISPSLIWQIIDKRLLLFNLAITPIYKRSPFVSWASNCYVRYISSVGRSFVRYEEVESLIYKTKALLRGLLSCLSDKSICPILDKWLWTTTSCSYLSQSILFCLKRTILIMSCL